MTEKRKNAEAIERFLTGAMSSDEIEAMMAQMQVDEELKQSVFLQRLVTEKLLKYGERQKQAELENIHDKYFGKKGKRRFIWYCLFGLGLFLTTCFIYLQLLKPGTHKKITIAPAKPKQRFIPSIHSAPEVKKNPERKRKHINFRKVIETNPQPDFPSELYDRSTVQDLQQLSTGTKGGIQFASAQEIGDRIKEVLSNHLEEGSELVVLMDKTQSMNDDLQEVRENARRIMSEVNKKKASLCFSSFGDVNYNTDNNWFSSTGFTNKEKDLENFLKAMTLVQGVDTPESLYDALCYQLDEYPFTTENKRLVILMTDASAQKGDFTVNDEKQTLSKCKALKVHIFSIVLQPDKNGTARAGGHHKK